MKQVSVKSLAVTVINNLQGEGMRKITDRQKIVLQWICDFKNKNQYSPTLAEIAKGLGMNLNGAQGHIAALKQKGFISITANIARSIVVLKEA